MQNRRPETGEIYRHFKNKPYQIVAVAEHSETGEELVIYQALYGEYRVYARPLAMFVSEVDHEKYPEVSQKYRFERMDRSALTEKDAAGQSLREPQEEEGPSLDDAKEPREIPDGADGADPRLLEFLDADTFLEKYQVIKGLEHEITDRLINDFAVALDVVIPEGELSRRYIQLKQCVATMCRYETSRLR